MDDLLTQSLAIEEQSPTLIRMLEDCKALLSISRKKMNEYYPTWDKNDQIFRGEMQPDKADAAARERKEPEKMVVPITYSQIQTFTAFSLSLLFQREHLFELTGFTPDDEAPAKVGEALLARDLNYNKIKAKMHQFFTDIGRFSTGIIKVGWHKETQFVKEKVTVPGPSFAGIRLGADRQQEVEREVVKYQGNRLTNISPYRFYPDVRLPFVRFQEGEFCASEELYSIAQLKQWEREGLVSGVDFIKPVSQDVWQTRGFRWNDWMTDSSSQSGGVPRGDGQLKKLVIISEIQRRLIPSQYKINDVPIGEEDYPVLWNFWIANDNRIIKAEPMNYVHNEFTYVMAPFLYDNNSLLGLGLADIIDQLQSVITWFINSRITSVRKTIDNKFLINPKYINFSDVENRRPYIRLLESAPGDLDRYIKQLTVMDVTQNHIADVKYLHELIQIITGINDSLLGQFQPGRRSATEHRNVTTGSAARLKTIVQTIYDVALEPMARQMLSNLRDGLDEETYVRVLGAKATATPEFTQVTKEDLVGRYDFEIFDGTLPSERSQIAQVLSDLATPFITNPEAGLALGYDVRKLLNEILLLRGVKNPERFMTEPQPQVLQQPNANGSPTTNGTNPGAVPPRSTNTQAEPVLSTGGGANYTGS